MRAIPFFTIVPACSLFLSSVFPAFAQQTPPPRLGGDARKNYQQLCATCHGEDMRGSKTESLLDTHWKYIDGSDEGIAAVIRDGLPLSGMPAFGDALNAAEVRGLVVLIRENAMHAGMPIPRRSTALPADVQKSAEHAWRVESVLEGLDVPWGIDFLPDGRLIFTERAGKLFVVEKGGAPVEITGIPRVWVRDEGGLMDVALHPDYARNGWVYLTLSDPGENDTAMTKIVRGRIRDGRWADEQTIFSAPKPAYTSRGIHFGSRLLFDGGYLFFSVGERGAMGQAQDLSLPNGKVHRVFDDGSIPPDNPFVKTPGAWPSIWSYGHRNPQGLARDPAGGGLWETEHGPRGGDELNLIRPGANYGWPVITYGMNYNGTPVSAFTAKEGMEQPVRHWTPSIATSPLHFYTGDKFPRWKNNLFLGSLAGQQLVRFVIDGDKIANEEIVFKNLGRIRDIATGPDGLLYVSLELPGEPSRIVRLIPADE
ncbi:PQQ-dependent sugar dehydrogenase [Termitidicoccus mucosus]